MRRPRNTTRGLAAALAVVGLAGALAACETPVWRYALYRWAVEPYTLVLFESGPAAVEWTLDDPAANVEFVRVKRNPDGSFHDPPEWLREVLAGTPSDAAAALVSPRGALVHVVPAADIASEQQGLARSPAREEIAAQLATGRSGLLLVLSTADQAASDAVVEEVKAVIARGAAGQIKPGKNLPANVTVSTSEPPPDLGMLVVDRDDPQERWLVRILLAAEEGLAEFDAPMVFGIYGRGRAMEPYVGAGITPENLDECVGYMTGACSCEIKAQNPGVDLLMVADWEAISQKVQGQFADDDVLQPAPTPEEDLAVAVAGGPAEVEEPPPSQPQPDRPSLAPAGQAAAPPVDFDAPPAAAAPAEPVAAEPAFGPRLVQRLFLLGIGVVVATAIAGLALWRLRG